MKDLVIRYVRASDEAAIGSIYDACLANRPDCKGQWEIALEMYTIPVNQATLLDNGFPVLVALHDDAAVGFAALKPEDSTISNR